MSENCILYVGYGSAEAWLRDHPIGIKVNVDTITEEHSGSSGLGHAYTWLVLSYHEQGTDEVSYLQVKIDGWQTVNGKPFAQSEAEALKIHQRRAESALGAAQDWLTSQGVPFRRSVIAMPRDTKILEGDASWLKYHKDSDEFGVAEESAQP